MARNSLRKSKRKSKSNAIKRVIKDVYGSLTIEYFKSDNPRKKWMIKQPKKVYFGDPHMQDYTQHHSKVRRMLFRKRMAGIKLKDGSRAIDKRYSPAHLSYYVTW